MNRSGVRAILFACALAIGAHGASSGIRLAPDGWFRTASGELFVPLGGFHGNMIPAPMVKLSPEEFSRVEPHIWKAGPGYIDLWDASDDLMRQWFGILAANGVTAVRLFPRARIGEEVLDICGRLNPALRDVFHRAFAAARPHGIRVLLQIIPEPWLTGYMNEHALERYALPHYTKEELNRATPAQKRFLIDRKLVSRESGDWFTDPDVLACQKQYLEEALAWVAGEPQVFALELYNEQGSGPDEAAELRWTEEIVRFIRQRLPEMPVTISHPGAGLTAFNPLKWSRLARVDFYSSHLYAGDCGENKRIDFAAVTGATTAVLRAEIVNFPGEWGVLDSKAPEEIQRRSYRDALWLSLMAGGPGFMQWTYDFLDEYRRASEIFDSLPKRFSPERPAPVVDIGPEYRGFHDEAHYTRAARFRPERRADPRLTMIYEAYNHSLDIGVPVSFSLSGGIPLESFLKAKGKAFPRPVEAQGGYQLAYLADSSSRVWIAYLRNRKVRAFGKHFLGEPKQSRLRLRFRLPEGDYDAEIVDLSVGRRLHRRIAHDATLDIARRTSNDYVVVIRGSAGT
ncbi:MAG: hypothetical protein ACM3S5_02200 [Rhodospirillales bacterium]